MIHDKKVTVVLPAFNAEATLRQTVDEIPEGFIDDLILVDDGSLDRTAEIARELGLYTVVHDGNLGYGANQKTCYREALQRGTDVVILLHPDYQYIPKLLVALSSLVAVGQYDLVLGSRILSEGALQGGMPLYKYVANRALTLFENILLAKKLSEYHAGYRAFSSEVLRTLPLAENSNDFVFDNQMLAQAAYFGFRIGEVSCPAHYFPEASSINLRRGVVYGLGGVGTSILYRLNKWRLIASPIFSRSGKPLIP